MAPLPDLLCVLVSAEWQDTQDGTHMVTLVRDGWLLVRRERERMTVRVNVFPMSVLVCFFALM